ncbi:MAG: hypothetical protein M3R27_11575 [Bacteroidota bacterium]|nr:hypothetical protein [Bacteroidota bacterium]
MIHFSKNNSDIYQLLETRDQLPDNYSESCVFTFDSEDHFHLVIYSAPTRDFFLFKGNDPLQDKTILPELLNMLLETPSSVIPVELTERCVTLIEDRIHSGMNSGFYFDAH